MTTITQLEPHSRFNSHPLDAVAPSAMTRRALLAGALGAAGLTGLPTLARTLGPAGGGGGPPAGAAGPQGAGGGDGGLPPWFPHQDPELVKQMVGASHGDLAAVRELVEHWPELAKAQWDWGFGDWESALGAASHTGNREIAELLLAHGARPTLFSAAMLGQLAVVQAFVEASPGIQGTPGPHGIPLLIHARTGGEAAASVVAYLEEVGGAEGGEAAGPGPERRSRYLGAYRADTAGGGALRDQHRPFRADAGPGGWHRPPPGSPGRRRLPPRRGAVGAAGLRSAGRERPGHRLHPGAWRAHPAGGAGGAELRLD